MKQFILLCLLVIPILSCKKKDDEKMTISGQVRDSYQSIAVSGVTVDLYVKKIESGVYSGSYSLIESSVSDNSGNFSFSFDAVMASNYKLSFRKQGYFNSEEEINSDKVTKGNDYNNTYDIHSEAYLKLHIVNNPPNTNQDQLVFRIKNGALNALDCCWDTVSIFTGKNVNVWQKCKIYGSQKIVFEWSIQTTNSTIFHYDSIFCAPFDTTFYEIPY